MNYFSGLRCYESESPTNLLLFSTKIILTSICFQDAQFVSARLTLSKIGTFQFYGGPKTVDVAAFLRQVAHEEGASDSKFTQKIFTECIKTILGDSIVYYSYDKGNDDCCQLDPNLFECIMGKF